MKVTTSDTYLLRILAMSFEFPEYIPPMMPAKIIDIMVLNMMAPIFLLCSENDLQPSRRMFRENLL